jgi:hypothetical protein
MENIKESGVLGSFDEIIQFKCSIGGANSGIIAIGTVLTENPSSTLLLAISFGP